MSDAFSYGKVPHDVAKLALRSLFPRTNLDGSKRAPTALSATEVRVYLTILAHVNKNSWTAFPGMANLIAAARVSERQVSRAVARLISCGLITRVGGGGKGIAATYLVETDATKIIATENGDAQRVTVPAAKGVAVHVTVTSENGDAQRVTVSPSKGDIGAAKRCHRRGETVTSEGLKGDSLHVRPTAQQQNNPNSNHDDSGGGSGGGGGVDGRKNIEQRLRDLGVEHDGTIAAIAATPAMSIEIVELLATETIGRGLSPGSLVNRLRDAEVINEISERIKSEQAATRKAAESSAASFRAAEAIEAEERRRVAWASSYWSRGLAPCERDEILAEVAGGLSEYLRARIARPDPSSTAPLPRAWAIRIEPLLRRRDADLVERGRLLGVHEVLGSDANGNSFLYQTLHRNTDEQSDVAKPGITALRYTGPINSTAQHAGAG